MICYRFYRNPFCGVAVFTVAIFTRCPFYSCCFYRLPNLQFPLFPWPFLPWSFLPLPFLPFTYWPSSLSTPYQQKTTTANSTAGPVGSMQMSMCEHNSHTILQNYPLWCCCHVMYKLLYPSIRVRTAPPVSVRVRVRVSFTL